MWSEIQQVQEHQRRELVLSGPDVAKKIAEGGLDERVFDLVILNFLEISKTGLVVLDDRLGKLVHLNRLILHDNKLQKLPDAIRNLSKLKFFDVSTNELKELPDVFQNMKELHSLNASVNAISAVADLSHCVHLTYIDLSFNKLQTFPETICSGYLPNLLEIKLNSNELTNVSPNLVFLPGLKQLDLSSNKITEIPKELSQCPKLKEVLLHDNPIKDPRLNKLTTQKPPKFKAILEYVRDHCVAAKVEPVNANEGKGKGSKGGKKKGGKAAVADEKVQDAIRVLPADDSSKTVMTKANVQQIRPFILCCVLQNLALDIPAKMKKFIGVQTDLHDEFCDKRTLATIATHDLDLINGDLTYDARLPAAIKLLPLKRQSEVTAEDLMAQLKAEADALRKEKKRNTYSGIHKYLNLLHEKPLYPCMMAADGTVISFPPITNSDKTRISATTQNVLLEVTSSKSLAICKTVAERLITSCLKMNLVREEESKQPDSGTENGEAGEGDAENSKASTPRTLVIQQVRVVDEAGDLRVVYPSRVDLNLEDFNVIRDYD